MLFYLLNCFVIVISASSGHTLENAKVSHTSEGRIAGGEETIDEAYVPFQAQVSSEGASFCSGVLYNEQHILTAAHCVENAKPKDLIVRVGSEVRGEGILVPISKIVQHPDYDSPQNNFDVAVLRATTPLVFTRDLQGVYSVEYVDDDFGKEMQVSGWGYQNGKNQLSDDLRYVVLPIVNTMECNIFYPGRITKNMLCGYSRRNTGKGACVGDGGSPAVIPHKRILLGISSFTAGCGPGMGPSVFTFVQAKEIRDFILNNTIMESQSGQRPGTPSGRPGTKDDDYYYDYYDKAEGNKLTNNTYRDYNYYGTPIKEYEGYNNVTLYDEGSERPPQQLDYGQPEHRRTEHGQPGHGRSEHGKSGHERHEHGKSGHGRHENGKSEHGWHEHGKSGHGRHEHGKSEHGQYEHEKSGHGQTEHGQPGLEQSEHERQERPSELLDRSTEGSEHKQSERSLEQTEHEPLERPLKLPERPSEGLKHERSDRLSEQLERNSELHERSSSERVGSERLENPSVHTQQLYDLRDAL